MRFSPSRPSALLAWAAAVLLLGTSCSSDGASDASGSGESGEDGTSDGGSSATSCAYPDDGRGAAREVEKPPEEPPYSGEVDATITLVQGDIGVALDAAEAPCTVTSFASLAEQGYFDDTPCHRLTTQGIFVLQCGDPTGSGAGGPGYSFADELSGEETYPAGTLAMANAGPDTNGSQFFLVYQDTELPPAYTVFGTMSDEGLDLVSDIAANGVQGGAPDGPPAKDVTVESVTVDE